MDRSVEPGSPPPGRPSLDVGVGKPPRHHLTSIRHCASSARIAAAAASSNYGPGLGTLSLISPTDVRPGFLPVFRSGIPAPGAFYGNILKFIVEDVHFPSNVENAIRGAFVKADHALADSHSLDSSSGTTALTALIFGRTLFVANAGDCRAILGKRGRAVELSRDHKPNCKSEKIRIENLGGTVFDGYLNGQLAVARALGDWHMKGPKGSISPLSAEPELQEIVLTNEDEFLIIGRDGLWDVMTSQCP